MSRSDGIYVTKRKRGKKCTVSGMVGGKQTYFGTFDSVTEANDFAADARKELGIEVTSSRRRMDPRARLAQVKKRLLDQ